METSTSRSPAPGPANSTGVAVRRRRVDHRGVEAQHLLDRGGGQRRVGAQRRPALALFQQPAHGVAEQVRRGLVARQQQPEQDRCDLLLGERAPVAVRGVHEIGGEVVTRMRAAVLGERFAITPELRHPCRDLHLLVLVRAAEHEQQPVGRARLHRLDVRCGDAEHLEDHASGQLPGERRDDVGPALVEPIGDEAPHGVAHEPLHLRHAPWREREVGDPAGASVRGRVDVREGGDGAKAPVGERCARSGARGRHGSEAVPCREGAVLPQHPLAVGVPGHHPVAQHRRPEHRRRTEPGELGVGIGEERLTEGVERRDRHGGLLAREDGSTHDPASTTVSTPGTVSDQAIRLPARRPARRRRECPVRRPHLRPPAPNAAPSGAAAACPLRPPPPPRAACRRAGR